MEEKSQIDIMKEIKENGKTWGMYVPNSKLPKAKTRQDLYAQLKLGSAFSDVNGMHNFYQRKMNELVSEDKYKDSFIEETSKRFYNEFLEYKKERYSEVRDELVAYRNKLKEENTVKGATGVELNSLLIQLSMIQSVENNDEAIARFLQDNIHTDEIRNMIGLQHSKTNPKVANILNNYDREQNQGYELLDSEINTLNMLINNSGYIVNEDYIEKGIRNFEEVKYHGEKEVQQETTQQEESE